MTKTIEDYKAMGRRHQEEYNSLFANLKPLVFHAFGDKQFGEALDKYLEAGGDRSQLVMAFGGLYGQEDKVDELFTLMERHGDEKRDALRADKAYAIGAFRNEMAEHDYCWSGDDEDVLNSLGLTPDDLVGDLADWYEEARCSYMEATENLFC